jgi:hypothetical protein
MLAFFEIYNNAVKLSQFNQSKSECHFLDKFRLNSAVSLVLSIEVLSLVSHSVACVACDWELDLLNISIPCGIGCHSCLKAITHLLELRL